MHQTVTMNVQTKSKWWLALLCLFNHSLHDRGKPFPPFHCKAEQHKLSSFLNWIIRELRKTVSANQGKNNTACINNNNLQRKSFREWRETEVLRKDLQYCHIWSLLCKYPLAETVYTAVLSCAIIYLCPLRSWLLMLNLPAKFKSKTQQ